MPRVPAAHRAVRREQILEAAWHCFARNGFHQTSMQEIFTESGLSAGAVYRYFPAKVDLLRATAEMVSSSLDTAFDALNVIEPVPGPADAARIVVDGVFRFLGGGDANLGRLAVFLWSAAAVDAELGSVVADVGERARRRWAGLAVRWKDAGHLREAADPDDVARLMHGLTMGFVLERELLGDLTPDRYLAGFGALFTGSESPKDRGDRHRVVHADEGAS